MIPFKTTNLLEFSDRFKTEEDCRNYLIELKWGEGFSCTRCSGKVAVRSKTWYYRRCKSCNYDESATANTLFHKIKFPLLKAFHMLFRISINKKGASSVQLAKEFNVNQKTAWLFRQKAQIAMKKSGKTKLTGKVHVDEFSVGGPEVGAPGRSHSAKNKVILGMESRGTRWNRRIGLAYAECIEDYTAKTFRQFFKSSIDHTAKIETDGFASYNALKDEYKIEQFYSDKGMRFPKLHCLIMNIKSWLRGTHHKCGYKFMQKYLDEFIFRFNRRNSQAGIFHTLISRFMKERPRTLLMITT